MRRGERRSALRDVPDPDEFIYLRRRVHSGASSEDLFVIPESPTHTGGFSGSVTTNSTDSADGENLNESTFVADPVYPCPETRAGSPSGVVYSDFLLNPASTTMSTRTWNDRGDSDPASKTKKRPREDEEGPCHPVNVAAGGGGRQDLAWHPQKPKLKSIKRRRGLVRPRKKRQVGVAWLSLNLLT